MRLLLGIIAGLIVTDLVKAAVGTVELTSPLASFRSDDFALAAAALVFVTRVLIDNSLYYARPDAKTRTSVYVVRLFLIICDLISYSLCYFIVVHTERLSSAPDYNNRLRAIAHAAVIIEGLHFIWCVTALAGLEISQGSDDYKSRRSWLKKWAWLSGSFAALGAIPLLLAYCRVWLTPDWLAFIVLFSMASTLAYVCFMKTEYLGNWKAAVRPAKTNSATSNLPGSSDT